MTKVLGDQMQSPGEGLFGQAEELSSVQMGRRTERWPCAR